MMEMIVGMFVVAALFAVGVWLYYPDHPLQHAYFYALMLYSVALGWSGAERSLQHD